MESIKKRTVKVDNMNCTGCEETISRELLSLNGICEIHPDYKTGKIRVNYDLLKIKLKDIEKKLDDLDYSVHNNLINRISSGLIHFTEENERSNLSIKPASCCSNPEDILAKAGKKSIK